MKEIANHSEKRFMFPLNLQLFAEGDPVEEVVEQPADQELDNAEQTIVAEPFLKIKYNKEEVELDRDKAAEYAQKGMNYDKAVERAREESRQEARDSFIAESGYVFNGKPIKTEAEYKQAIQDQQLIASYKEREVPDDLIPELVEAKNFRTQYEKDRESTRAQERIQKDFDEFTAAFATVKPDEIPQAVWDEVAKGTRLVDAYTNHENSSMRQRLAAFEQKELAEKQNNENAQSSTGAVTGQGTVAVAFITQDTFEKNRDNPQWVKNNFAKIMESRSKWK